RAGSVMRGLRDVARISRAKGADLQAICAMKEGLRLAQSIPSQPFDKIGILRRFSRFPKADSGRRKKRDSDPLFASRSRGFCGRGGAAPSHPELPRDGSLIAAEPMRFNRFNTAGA